MDIEKTLGEKIQQFQDINRQLMELNKKIGTLQEEGRAIHQTGMQLQGAIQALGELKEKQDAELATSKTAGLTLPEGVKPVIPEAPAAVAPVALEVK